MCPRNSFGVPFPPSSEARMGWGCSIRPAGDGALSGHLSRLPFTKAFGGGGRKETVVVDKTPTTSLKTAGDVPPVLGILLRLGVQKESSRD